MVGEFGRKAKWGRAVPLRFCCPFNRHKDLPPHPVHLCSRPLPLKSGIFFPPGETQVKNVLQCYSTGCPICRGRSAGKSISPLRAKGLYNCAIMSPQFLVFGKLTREFHLPAE